MMKQLIVVADMEGASGIFGENRSWNQNAGRIGGNLAALASRLVFWLCATHAAVDFGINDILLYDGHFAGNHDFNVILEQLPPIARVFEVWNRVFDWRRFEVRLPKIPLDFLTACGLPL